MYMAVTSDKYELPLAVCDTARELGALFGVSANLIQSSISKNLSGKNKGFKFVKVDDVEEGTCFLVKKCF